MNAIVGIDIAKHELVIDYKGQTMSIANTVAALQQWYKSNSDLLADVELFAYEPTGGYEKILESFLRGKELPARMCHANHVRKFAKAMGYAAKTDKIDAKVIAEYAHVKGLTPTTWKQEHPDLVQMIARREQLIDTKKQESNRLEITPCAVVKKDVKSQIKQLQKRIDEMDKHIKAYIDADDKLKSSIDNLSSIPGVGFVTAVTIVAYMPEIDSASSKQLSALAGLAPFNQDSGKKKGKRKVQGGRSPVRRVLYMAAFSAIRHNPDIKRFYDRLKEKGKPYKVAITAAMRKLLSMMRSLYCRNTPWEKAMVIKGNKAVIAEC